MTYYIETTDKKAATHKTSESTKILTYSPGPQNTKNKKLSIIEKIERPKTVDHKFFIGTRVLFKAYDKNDNNDNYVSAWVGTLIARNQFSDQNVFRLKVHQWSSSDGSPYCFDFQNIEFYPFVYPNLAQKCPVPEGVMIKYYRKKKPEKGYKIAIPNELNWSLDWSLDWSHNRNNPIIAWEPIGLVDGYVWGG